MVTLCLIDLEIRKNAALEYALIVALLLYILPKQFSISSIYINTDGDN